MSYVALKSIKDLKPEDILSRNSMLRLDLPYGCQSDSLTVIT